MTKNNPQAAVALIITECASPSVLLLRRAKHAHDPWSGQWAFPGGKWEENDKDLIATSIRETFEECGCVLSRDELNLSLPLATAGNHSGFPILVAPFVWKLNAKKELLLDNTEIEDARWQEITALNDPALHGDDLVIPSYPEKKFPHMMLGDVPLWGFTYHVLMNYLNSQD